MKLDHASFATVARAAFACSACIRRAVLFKFLPDDKLVCAAEAQASVETRKYPVHPAFQASMLTAARLATNDGSPVFTKYFSVAACTCLMLSVLPDEFPLLLQVGLALECRYFAAYLLRPSCQPLQMSMSLCGLHRRFVDQLLFEPFMISITRSTRASGLFLTRLPAVVRASIYFLNRPNPIVLTEDGRINL